LTERTSASTRELDSWQQPELPGLIRRWFELEIGTAVEENFGVKTARFWHQHEGGKVQCDLCPHRCVLSEGKAGICKVRRAVGGELQAVGHGLISSAHLDPIEKKPLYHFYPGAEILSIGGWGCNLVCVFCQNWTISQQIQEEGTRYDPSEIAKQSGMGGSIGIAYTYNEPLIAFEFVSECARLVKAAGRVNVLVTNGYVLPEPAAELLPWIDALNIDIKSMEDEFYRRHCHGSLQPVLDFSKQSVQAGCHVEITNLLIPSLNDSAENIAALAAWIADNLGEDIPLHLSAYHPMYKCKIPGTPVSTLEKAYEICRRKLRFVYLGNVYTEHGRNTVCPGCGALLIRRRGYASEIVALQDGACSQCGRPANVVM